MNYEQNDKNLRFHTTMENLNILYGNQENLNLFPIYFMQKYLKCISKKCA